MTETLTGVVAQASAMAPVPYRVRSRVVENADSVTLHLEPVAAALPTALPGEFMMLYAFGVGEVAISTSGIIAGRHPHPHHPLGGRGQRRAVRRRTRHHAGRARTVRHHLGSGRGCRP